MNDKLPPLDLLDLPDYAFELPAAYEFRPLPAAGFIPVYHYGKRVFTIERGVEVAHRARRCQQDNFTA